MSRRSFHRITGLASVALASATCVAGVGAQAATADPAPPGFGLKAGAVYVGSDGNVIDRGLDGERASIGVNAANGNLVIHEVDGPLASTGGIDRTNPVLHRWYNSFSTARRDLGDGWTSGVGYDVRAVTAGATVTVYAPSDERVTFSRQANGTFTSSDPDTWTLISEGGGVTAKDATYGRTYRFDAYGRLSTMTNASEVTERYDYTSANGQDRLSALYGDNNRATRLSYDGSGSIIEADDPTSAHGYYRYTGSKLTQVTATSGAVTNYRYDAAGRLASRGTPSGTVDVTYAPDGRVSTLGIAGSATTFAYAGADGVRCDPTEAVTQTTVAGPSAIPVTYCFDAAGELVNGDDGQDSDDIDGPDTSFTDGAAALDGEYVGGTRVLDLGSVADDGEGDGVASTTLSRAGTPLATNSAACGSGCPEQFASRFRVETAGLPEGRNSLTLSAVDAAGNERAGDSIDLLVDKTPPTAPSRVGVADFDAASGEATIDWVPGLDPDLAPDVPGSGANTSEYRVKRGATWSTWGTTGTDFVVLSNATEGETLTVEIRAMDDAGNRSAFTTATVTVKGDQSQDAVPMRVAAVDGGQNCTPTIDYARSRVIKADVRNYKEVRNSLGARISVYCISNRSQKIQVTGAISILLDENVAKQVDDETDLGTVEIKSVDQVKFSGINAICRPASLQDDGYENDGTQRYIVTGSIKYIRPGATNETAEYATEAGDAANLWCPPPSTREDRVEDAWRALSRFAPSRPDLRETTARVQLRRRLGEQPYTPKGTKRAWEAHHVVPVRDPRAVQAHVVLWRCEIHPNSAENGVYLRGFGLKKQRVAGVTNPKWLALKRKSRALSRRTYHGDTMGDRYFELLNEYLVTSNGQNRCDPVDMPSGLEIFRRQLIDGVTGVERENH